MDPLVQTLRTMLAGSIIVLVATLTLTVAWLVFFLNALIHCLRHKHDQDRLTWVIVMIFVPVIGTILYLTIGRDQGGRDHGEGDTGSALPPAGSPPPVITAHAMEDEKARAAAINASLSASSASRQRGK